MEIPKEVQILNVTEVPRFVGAQVTVELWITYQAGVLPPRSVTILKAEDSPEARRLAIRADIEAAMAADGPISFRL